MLPASSLPMRVVEPTSACRQRSGLISGAQVDGVDVMVMAHAGAVQDVVVAEHPYRCARRDLQR